MRDYTVCMLVSFPSSLFSSLGRGDSSFLKHPSHCPSSVHAFVVITYSLLEMQRCFGRW